MASLLFASFRERPKYEVWSIFTTFGMGPFALGNFLHFLSLGKFVESFPNYIQELHMPFLYSFEMINNKTCENECITIKKWVL